MWLTALSIEEHSFLLTKSEFYNALCLRYGWRPAFLPDFCPYGDHFSVDNSLSCPTGGFPTLRHNETRDIVANLLDDVCHDVQKEPILQKLTGEIMPQKSNSTDDEARLDISACGFWGGRFQKTYFDVRIFNPHAQSYRSSAISSLYRKQEQEKKRKYEARIRRVEQASFKYEARIRRVEPPLIFSCTRGASNLTSKFLKRLSSLVSEKQEMAYSKTLCWVRCRLGFALLRSAVMCMRGCRSRTKRPIVNNSILLASAESGLSYC